MQSIQVFYDNKLISAELFPVHYTSANYAFDITPHDFVSNYITENGIFDFIDQVNKKI